MRNLSVFIFSCFFISSFGQQYSQKWTDINYANDAKNYHLLDIYLPKISKPTYPVVIYIYGSAWYSNSSKGSDMNTVGSALLDAGYAVVVPNHRSSSDSLYPAQINDIKAVIRFVRGNAGIYNFDTTFVGISGSSSGGHLAALAGTSGFVNQYTLDTITMDIEGNLGSFTSFSSNVDAVCDWFGPTDLLIIDSCRGSSFGTPGQTPEEVLVGDIKTENKTRFILASPITYIDPTDPPFLIFHGDADNVVPHCESEVLNNTLELAGVKSEYIEISGGQHYTGVHTEANFNKMIDFFNEISNNYISNIDTSTNITATSNLQNGNSVKLFPNPINDILVIQGISDISSPICYDILDISGSKIASDKIFQNRIDTSALNKGVYLFKLHLSIGNTITYKIIKI